MLNFMAKDKDIQTEWTYNYVMTVQQNHKCNGTHCCRLAEYLCNII